MRSLEGYSHLRGIEREALRILENGEVAKTDHPKALGSKLTNRNITVDFAETLLEITVPPENSITQSLESLTNLTSFANKNLPNNEYFLNTSMPLSLERNKVKIANFGQSNLGNIRNVYREGLSIRYSKIMQMIAGVHYNFSFDERLIKTFTSKANCSRNEIYFSVINNYFMFMWLLPYLFGSSPICAKTSTDNKPSYLRTLDDEFYVGEYSTSLRMSEVGYKNQNNLLVSYKSIDQYLKDLKKLINTPSPLFTSLGMYNKRHIMQQLNHNILQNDNEYYCDIKPKRNMDEIPNNTISNLLKYGVQYLEIRTLDANPFSPTGIEKDSCYFLEAILMTCLFLPIKKYSEKEIIIHRKNLQKVVKVGRKPKINLMNKAFKKESLISYGNKLLDLIEFHAVNMGDKYHKAVKKQRLKIKDVDHTTSAQVMNAINGKEGYKDWIIKKSKKIKRIMCAHEISEVSLDKINNEVKISLEKFKEIEKRDKCNFQSYLKKYYELINNYR